MAKIRDVEFATCAGAAVVGADRSISAAWPEEISVVPTHHGEAGARQTDDRVAERRSLPGFGGDAAGAEESFADRSIAGTIETAIECTQGCDQTIDATNGTWRRSKPATSRKPPEAQGRLRALWRCRVERDEGSQWRRVLWRIRRPELVGRRISSDDYMGTIFAVATLRCVRQVSERDALRPGSRRGRCRQNDNGREFVWMPEDGRFVSAAAWIGQKIATPNTGLCPRRRHRTRIERSRRRRDSRGCAAGTPRRGRTAPWLWRNHRRWATANPPSTWDRLHSGNVRMPGL